MRAREKMIATSHASAAAPVSFEDTLFQVSMKTQQRHAQARSLERLPTSSVSRGIDQDLPHSTSVLSNEISSAESDDDVPEGIPIKLITQVKGPVQRHEGQAVIWESFKAPKGHPSSSLTEQLIGESLAPKGQPTKHVAQGSLKDAPQQADIVSLDLMLLDQSAAAEIRRQVSGFGFRLEFRV
jgi:hypothetical protein